MLRSGDWWTVTDDSKSLECLATEGVTILRSISDFTFTNRRFVPSDTTSFFSSPAMGIPNLATCSLFCSSVSFGSLSNATANQKRNQLLPTVLNKTRFNFSSYGYNSRLSPWFFPSKVCSSAAAPQHDRFNCVSTHLLRAVKKIWCQPDPLQSSFTVFGPAVPR